MTNLASNRPEELADTPPEDARMQAYNPRSTWRVAGDTVRRNLATYSEEAQELLYWAFCYAVDRDIPRADLAIKLGFSDSTLYKVYSLLNKDPVTKELLPPNPKLLEAIRALRDEMRAHSYDADPDFVRTPSVEEIWALCNAARSSGTIAMLFARSHLGKTKALREYAVAYDHGSTPYIRVPAGGGKVALLQELAKAVKVPHQLSADKLKPRVWRAVRPGMLIIIDELHQIGITYHAKAKMACAELIRDLHDSTGVGMLLCGTHIWRDDLNIGRDRELLDQMARRGLYRLDLGDEPRKSDLAAIATHFGLPYPDGPDAAIYRTIAQSHGLLAVFETLRAGRRIAEREATPFAWRHVLAAWANIQRMSKAPRFDS